MVTVNRETVVKSVRVVDGNKSFTFEPSKNGVVVTSGKNTFTVPNGAVGEAFVTELTSMLNGAPVAPKAKRTRRTKAEMAAARANEANGNSTESAETETESTSDVESTIARIHAEAMSAE